MAALYQTKDHREYFNPKISVLMPNYNKGSYIREAIQSVLDQTFEDFELIVVDDASNDSSIEVIESFIKRDRRVRLVHHPKNLGVAAAFNTGMTTAMSNLICFIGSDDLYIRTKLAKQYELMMSGNQTAIVYCEASKVDETGLAINRPRNSPRGYEGMIFSKLLQENFMVHATMMVPKNFIDEAGKFDEALSSYVDVDMSLRLAKKHPFKQLNESLYLYRIYSGNTEGRISRHNRYYNQGIVVERYLIDQYSLLKPAERRKVLARLFSSFVATKQYGKLLEYGLTSTDGILALGDLVSRVV